MYKVFQFHMDYSIGYMSTSNVRFEEILCTVAALRFILVFKHMALVKWINWAMCMDMY